MQNYSVKLKNKNLRIIFSFFLYFSFLSPAYAAPCYGTKMPEKKHMFSGVENYTIFKRYLEDEFGKVRSSQNFLVLSYGIYNWLSLDLKGGAGYIKQHPAGSDEIDYPSSFAGGYGFRLRLYEDKKSKLVFGFQHISVHPHTVHLGDTKNEAVLDDWQFSLLASRNFHKFTPYLGARWSRVDYIHWVGDDRKRRMSDLTKSIGAILGVDLAVSKKVWLNLEAQFFDSEAIAAGINYQW